MAVSQNILRSLEGLEADIIEWTRATYQAPPHFVEPRTGALAEALLKRHHIVEGRRGSGKTSFLLSAAAKAGENYPIYLSCESGSATLATHLPLIDLLLTLLTRILEIPVLKGAVNKHEDVFVELRSEVVALEQLRREAAVKKRTKTSSQTDEDGGRGGVKIDLGVPPFKLNAQGEGGKNNTSSTIEESEVVEYKGELVEGRILPIAEKIDSLLKRLDRSVIVFLDEFSRFPVDEQPQILDMLKRISSPGRLFFKIAVIPNRFKSSAKLNGAQIGMEIRHDASRLPLEHPIYPLKPIFDFQGGLLQTLLNARGTSKDEVLSEGGFNQLVLASGGLTRDFLNIFRGASGNFRARIRNGADRSPRIYPADVREGARENDRLRREEFRRVHDDVSDQCLALLEGISDFCGSNKTQIFLINMSGDRELIGCVGILYEWGFIHIHTEVVYIQTRDYRAYWLDSGVNTDLLALDRPVPESAAGLVFTRAKDGASSRT